VKGGDNIMASPLGNIETPLEVHLPILIEPVVLAGTGKKRGSLIEGLEGGEYEGIQGGG
jgi:hypothetical protein